jgi:hypothetical protein
MQDKITLLMEETGCDRGEAELALEMTGYQVEEAIRAIARLLRNIVVLKGKFVHQASDQFGLFQLVGNLRTGGLLRARAVLSFNPAVYNAGLDRNWFEFEKHLYGCRLWEGSLQAESLEIEQTLGQRFRLPGAAERLGRLDEEALAKEVGAVLAGLFKAPVRRLQVKREILDLREFQSLNPDPDRTAKARAAARRPADELLVLKVRLEESAEGVPASELRAGDLVAAAIVDKRDIAQYLSKLFGGFSEKGPLPILVPVEALESSSEGVLARVRFSVGVCGDATAAREARVRVVRYPEGEASRAGETTSWWKRFFKS